MIRLVPLDATCPCGAPAVERLDAVALTLQLRRVDGQLHLDAEARQAYRCRAGCTFEAPAVETLDELLAAVSAAVEAAHCENAPFVCPGCYSIGEEPCASYCIDAAMEREAEERELYGDDEDECEECAW